MADYEGEGNGQSADIFSNNHDLIGVEGIIRSQKNEIEKKKVGLSFPKILYQYANYFQYLSFPYICCLSF